MLTAKKVLGILNSKLAGVADAYDVAVAQGFVGTRQDWLNSLIGADIHDITMHVTSGTPYIKFEYEPHAGETEGKTFDCEIPFVSAKEYNAIQVEEDGFYFKKPIVPISMANYELLDDDWKMDEDIIWNVYDAPQTVFTIDDTTTGVAILWSSKKINEMIGDMSTLTHGTNLVQAINYENMQIEDMDIVVDESEGKEDITYTLQVTFDDTDHTLMKFDVSHAFKVIPLCNIDDIDTFDYTDETLDGKILVWNKDTKKLEWKDGLGDTYESAKDYTDYAIDTKLRQKSKTCDSKPTWDATNHCVVYFQGGVRKTTEDEVWFYYKVTDPETGDVSSMQTKYIDGVDYTIGAGQAIGDIPVNQELVTVNSLDACYNACPNELDFFVLGNCKFTAGIPELNKSVRVLISKPDHSLTIISPRFTYKTIKTGTEWSHISSNIRSLGEWTNITRDGAISNMTEFPSHTEIMRATFVPSDSPNHSLGDTYYLDARAWAPGHFTLIAQGYGEEYISHYNEDPTTHTGSWTDWQDTGTAVGKYFESTALTECDWDDIEAWVIANIPNYNSLMYTVTFGDVTFVDTVSPTELESTHYNVVIDKLSDHGIMVEALVTSGGTAEYPNGTKFRCSVSKSLVQSDWVVISSSVGVLEVTDILSSMTRETLLTDAQSRADREKFTVIYDGVTFTSAEAPTTSNPTCWIELVNTGDRQFMRASTRELVNNKYFNKIYYSCKIASGWSEWTPVNASEGGSGCEVGSVIAWSSENIPTGWLVCDGREVSKTSFANLYDVIGDTYGVASDPNKFKLPDLTDRFIMGTATDDTDLFGSVEAGLPNITGTSTGNTEMHTGGGASTSALWTEVKGTAGPGGTGGMSYGYIKFDASRNNSIYGNSTTVQPPAVKLLYIICTGDGKPKTVVDTLELANTTSGTIKFGKDNLGNYGYYKGDDPVFHKFVDPGDIEAEYTLLASSNLSEGGKEYTLAHPVTDYDMLIVDVKHGSTDRWARTIFPSYTWDTFNTTETLLTFKSEQIRGFVQDANTFKTYCYQVQISGIRIYGVKFKCEVDTPSSLKLCTDLTKEIRFGTDTNGVNGYWIENDEFISLEGGVLVELDDLETDLTTAQLAKLNASIPNVRLSVSGDVYNLSYTDNTDVYFMLTGTNAVTTEVCIDRVTGEITTYEHKASIETLEDVELDSSLDDNQVLAWDSTDSKWKNIDPALLVLDAIYPVGAICLGTHPTVGTWEKVTDASGKSLWGSDSSHLAGTTIAAGLPNLTGSVQLRAVGSGENQNVRVYSAGSSGIITGSGGKLPNNYLNASAVTPLTAEQVSGFKIDASKNGTDLIYGNSTTVQPPAYVVDIWKRIS